MIVTAELSLRDATKKDTFEVYNWLYFSDLADILYVPKGNDLKYPPSYSEFCEAFPEFYFNGSEMDKGKSYIIQLHDTSIGHISYTCYHMQEGIAEIDIWLAASKYIGYGYGVNAINLIGDTLKNLGFKILVIRPPKDNELAIQAYKKAGFCATELLAKNYYLPEYECVVEAAHGEGNDNFLTKQLI